MITINATGDTTLRTAGKYCPEDILIKVPEGTELPELSNEGTASDLLAGKELIDGDGNKVTGTIATKTASNLTASGATVTVPAGYYASQATKSVATATRADTTISVSADDTNDKLTITASNNQSTGYVTGANKTASKTISLTASGATVTASDGTNSISKSVATATQATPSISVNSSGLITASATQTAGYVSAGTKSGTKQLTTQAAKTITPTKSSQTAVASGVYTTGSVTVGAIPSEYITTTDATASADEIMSGETAYVNGSKVTGTFSIDSELNTQDDLISQIQTALAGKAAGGGEQATPVISVNNYNGLITATAGAKTSTHQLAFQAAKTITPSTASQIAVSSGYYTGGDITVGAIPSQYIVPSGTLTITTNGTHNVKNYTSAIVNVSGGGSGGDGYDEVDSLITMDMSTYTNSRATNIGQGAFAYASKLQSVNFPNVTTIGNSAFYWCSRLATISFPVATTIGSYAFASCYKLTTASFPVATNIGSGAFSYCSSLTIASFPMATSLNRSAFYYCYNLKSLYLTGSSICTLSNSNVFRSTPIGGYSTSAGTYGSIYVPASLLTSYQTATNWTYFSSRFVAYDGGGGNIISFTIDGDPYQAEEGMTWAEWINSEYNKDIFKMYDEQIMAPVGGIIVDGAIPSETIIQNKDYPLNY